jgi:hypothetical protein
MLVLLAKKGFFLLDNAQALVYTSDTLTACRYGDRSSIGRALDCGSSGCGFKPHRSPPFVLLEAILCDWTHSVTLLIVCPLWINYTSNSRMTNFASTFLPSSKLRPLATNLIEKHA